MTINHTFTLIYKTISLKEGRLVERKRDNIQADQLANVINLCMAHQNMFQIIPHTIILD